MNVGRGFRRDHIIEEQKERMHEPREHFGWTRWNGLEKGGMAIVMR
jgi:hypothetical protein